MALTVNKQEIRKVEDGYLVSGTFTWTSTNTTGTLPFAFGHIVGGVNMTPITTPTAAETHYVDTTDILNTTTGYIAVPATGLPVARVGASVTSALVVSYSYIAY
jgi:hypothetical protein